MNQFESIKDAQRYLNGSVLKFNNEFLVVKSCHHAEEIVGPYELINTDKRTKNLDWVALCEVLPSRRKRVVNLHLNVIPNQTLKMGFFNTDKSAHYLMRTPVRQVRLGLTDQSISWCNVLNPMDTNPALDFSHLIRRREFVDMLENKYPTVQECYEAGRLKAFSRCFALTPATLKVCNLFYKWNKVGEFDGESFTFYSQFMYVSDILYRKFQKEGIDYDIQRT